MAWRKISERTGQALSASPAAALDEELRRLIKAGDELAAAVTDEKQQRVGSVKWVEASSRVAGVVDDFKEALAPMRARLGDGK
jgi:hypothetical protein